TLDAFDEAAQAIRRDTAGVGHGILPKGTWTPQTVATPWRLAHRPVERQRGFAVYRDPESVFSNQTCA
ncbi:MAG: hypothetical protein VW931_01820, partial [Alphaproteobacteria bacterium]